MKRVLGEVCMFSHKLIVDYDRQCALCNLSNWTSTTKTVCEVWLDVQEAGNRLKSITPAIIPTSSHCLSFSTSHRGFFTLSMFVSVYLVEVRTMPRCVAPNNLVAAPENKADSFSPFREGLCFFLMQLKAATLQDSLRLLLRCFFFFFKHQRRAEVFNCAQLKERSWSQ